MITSLDFPRLVYRNPSRQIKAKRKPLDNIIGIDTEAYTTGKPFMFCTSLSLTHTYEQIPEIFFDIADYRGANFMLYNIKYDSGALLYHLPMVHLIELWRTGKVKFQDTAYTYIPHKMLRLTRRKIKVTFWDIAQYYKMSLDNAARIYLGDQKDDIETKSFTPAYVKKNWDRIAKYCIQDAILTARLGNYFVNKLLEFGIEAPSMYSSASISFSYYCQKAPKIVTSWRYYESDPEVLKFACDAYEGGKFEVTQRGYYPRLYEYDLTSAYPAEIMNLVDISRARVKYSSDYQADAVYGFLRCRIENPKGRHLPFGPMIKNTRIYPAGEFFITITKAEYEYAASLPDVKIHIYKAVWLFVNRHARRYPYRGVTAQLFKIKDEYKKKDLMLTSTAKIAMNGYYGKLAQVIEDHEKNQNAGAGWNPVYASIITANTRIKVTQLQNMLQDDCVAVHTDSVITKRPLSKNEIPFDGIGKWAYEIDGPGIVIACGMYQIADTCAFKGFHPRRGVTWTDLLSRNANNTRMKFSIKNKSESWVEVCAKGHKKNKINKFHDDTKIIDFNCDVKRIWLQNATGRDLLTKLQPSMPKIHIENSAPKHWQVLHYKKVAQ